jgi:hypothetical protein
MGFSSAAILRTQDGKYLVEERGETHKIVPARGRFSLVGGKAETGRDVSPAQTLEREIAEELGYGLLVEVTPLGQYSVQFDSRVYPGIPNGTFSLYAGTIVASRRPENEKPILTRALSAEEFTVSTFCYGHGAVLASALSLFGNNPFLKELAETAKAAKAFPGEIGKTCASYLGPVPDKY